MVIFHLLVNFKDDNFLSGDAPSFGGGGFFFFRLLRPIVKPRPNLHGPNLIVYRRYRWTIGTNLSDELLDEVRISLEYRAPVKFCATVGSIIFENPIGDLARFKSLARVRPETLYHGCV